MNFWTIDETAKKWGITPRQVRNYCAKGRIYGAILERGEWRQGSRLRLLDTCRTAQDIFIAGLRKFGHTKIAEKALAEQAKSEGKSE